MFTHRLSNCRARFLIVCGLLLGGLAVQWRPSSASAAENAAGYFRIEEDWALVILDPDTERTAPHVVTQMSPICDKAYFCNFEINHRRLPQFSSGGLQVQIWQDDGYLAYRDSGDAAFAINGETMTWTQYMERDGRTLKFGIGKGQSLTWGELSKASLNVGCSDLQATLGSYRSDYSATRSTISYGANRVKSLKLIQVRKYRCDASTGALICDIETAARTIWDESLLR